MLSIDERFLIDHVVGQRWFASKAREVIGARVVDRVDVAPRLTLLLVEIRFPEGTHDVYQLLAGTRDGEPDWSDGFADPTLARELVHEIRSGSTKQTDEGVIDFRTLEGYAALGRELDRVDIVTSEQSNSSVIFDEELILKVFRRLEAGVNPELEMLRFLTEHGFQNLASLVGWYVYVGRPLDATLGILQRYVANAVNGWDLGLDELGAAPERFLGRLHRLGEVTAEMHNVLASDANDPAFAPEETRDRKSTRLNSSH